MYTLLLEKRKTRRLTLDIALVFIALFWISRGKYFISFLLLIVAAVGFYIHRKRVVFISEAGIRYPFFIDKIITWREVSNILLKDDVLTIDLKTNSLLQSTVSAIGINEDDFNTYCKMQLESAFAQSLLKENS